MEFIKSGVDGLDEVLKGGFKKNASILLMGVPGTGKTILGIQFMYTGAKNKEPGLYITYEESVDAIYAYSKNLGFDFAKFKDLITVVNQPITGKIVTFGNIIDIIKKKKVKRVVLDSVTLFHLAIGDQASFRREILDFLLRMKECSVTFVATAERKCITIDAIKFHDEDFLFDGIILLTKVRKGSSYERCISIEKMRGHNYSLGIFPFMITDHGFEIFPKQLPFSLIERGEQ